MSTRLRHVAFWVAVLGLVVGAHAIPVDLSLEPTTVGPVNVGDTFDLELWARSNPAGQNVTAVSAYVKYDESLLEVVDVAGDPALVVIPGGGLNQEFRNEVLSDGLGGAIFYSAGNFSGVPADFLVATIPFKVTQQFSDTAVTLVAGPELRNNGELVCATKVTDLIEDVTGELVGADIKGDDRNEAPIADACPFPNEVYAIDPGGDLLLDGTGSYDPDGEIVDYLWKLMDQEVAEAQGATGNLTWGNLVAYGVVGPGSYPISLQVTDNGDPALTGIAMATLVVTPEPTTLCLLCVGIGAGVLRRRRRGRA